MHGILLTSYSSVRQHYPFYFLFTPHVLLFSYVIFCNGNHHFLFRDINGKLFIARWMTIYLLEDFLFDSWLVSTDFGSFVVLEVVTVTVCGFVIVLLISYFFCLIEEENLIFREKK